MPSAVKLLLGFRGEAGKVFYDVIPYIQGFGIDIGCGDFKIRPEAVGIDWNSESAVANLAIDCKRLRVLASNSMEYVFSAHTLEHIEDWQAALKDWWRVVKPGGYLVLYLPHPALYAIAQTGAENDDHKATIYPRDVLAAMEQNGGWDLMEDQIRDKREAPAWYLREYSFLQVYRKRKDGKRTYPCRAPQPEKTCALVRYGGFGDSLVMSSVLPALKDQGYHITVYTHDRGHAALKHDPHIDAFVVDRDSLGLGTADNTVAFLKHLRTKYDRADNMWQTFEVALLSSPNTAAHYWPYATRRSLYGQLSYLEMTHILADVPFPPRQKFYATEKELKRARKFKAGLGEGKRVVLLGLSGTGVHKTLPHMPEAVEKVLAAYPDVVFVTVGHERCKVLEEALPEDRVVRTSGKWTVREAFAFAQVADVVVGPETGLLNAVAMEPVPKVVCLSHSSEDNLVKFWESVSCVHPRDTYCHPCHQLHHSFDDCNPHPDHPTASLCAFNTHPDDIFGAIAGWLGESVATAA